MDSGRQVEVSESAYFFVPERGKWVTQAPERKRFLSSWRVDWLVVLPALLDGHQMIFIYFWLTFRESHVWRPAYFSAFLLLKNIWIIMDKTITKKITKKSTCKTLPHFVWSKNRVISTFLWFLLSYWLSFFLLLKSMECYCWELRYF